jgi:hypothetical protein
METTITKRIKGSVIENIFESNNNCNVRYYEAKNIKDDNYDPDKVYTFEIKIRHNEDQDPIELLNKAIIKSTN